MDIIVVGTHEYQWALFPFAELFAKYWGPERILYYGDRQEGPLPANLEFHRVPCYTEGVWPWQHWFGNGMRSIMDEMQGFLVTVFLPDHWLCSPVDHKALRKLCRFMDKRGNILRGNLVAGTCLDEHGQHVANEAGLEIVGVSPENVHCGFLGGMTFAPAVWNRALLRDILEPQWDLWAAEKMGTERMKKRYPGIMSVGTRPSILGRAHGLYHAQPRTASVKDLIPEDAEVVRRYLPAGWRVVT
jgi:hypothetical protein